MIDTGKARDIIGGPVGMGIGLIILLVLGGLTVADAISGELTTAATTGASFIVLALLMGVTRLK